MLPIFRQPLAICGLLLLAGCGGGGDSSSSDSSTSSAPYEGTCGVGTAAYALAAGGTTLTSPSFTIGAAQSDHSAFCAMNSGTSITLVTPTITSSAPSTSAVNASLYGTDAAVLAYGSSSTSTSGGAIAVSGGTITTSASYASGVFASGRGSGITVSSSAAITTSGTYAHAVVAAHSGTATVTNATLTSTAAEVVVLEGASTMTLVSSALASTNTTDNRGVYIHANPTGSGASTLSMTNGNYLWNSASSSDSAFYVYNQTTTINLTNVTLTTSTARLLTAAGPVGSNVTLNAINQDLTGSVVIEAGSTVAVKLDASSTWTLTGDSYVNELNVADCSKLIYGGHTLFYKSFAAGSAICSSPNLQLY